MIGTVVGRYRIDSLLGEGGMGRVYRAFDTTLGRQAAVKVLDANLSGERLQRFMREARTASSLNHPNVVTIYEVGELNESGHFIAMELVEGETLRDALRAGRIELTRTLEWTAQIADGIATAHAAGITHRDLKPENIVIARTGFAKILDFGLAKLREEAPDPDADTKTAVMATSPGVVLGTVGYMAPEQAAGREVDHRSDLFAIGCILYECISGRRPFAGESQIDTLHKIIYSDPAPLEERAPDTPRELQRIIRKLLAKDPEQRYQSAKDLALDLRDLKTELGSQSRAAPPVRKRSRLWLAIPLFIVIAIVGAIFSLKRPASTTAAHTTSTAAAMPMSITRVTATGKVLGSAISPDGEYIAYAHAVDGGQSIWIRQLASGSAIEIVPAARAGVWGLKFSPDSRSIYYGLKTEAGPAGVLYSVPILGGTPRQILANVESTVTFSPGGEQFAFHRVHTPKQGDSSIVIANADGSGERTLVAKSPPEHFSPSFWGAPAWSPDGKTIATGLRNGSRWKLVGVDVATGAIRDLSRDQWRHVTSLAWLPDGEIVVVAQHERVRPSQLWLVAADGSRRRITNDLYEYRTVTATEDGQSLLAVGAETRAAVWRATVDGKERPQKGTSGRYDGWGGVAAADDGTIVYGSAENSRGVLWRLDPGGTPRRLTGADTIAYGPTLTRDGKYVVFSLVRDDEGFVARINARDGSDLRVLAPTTWTVAPERVVVTPDSRSILFVASRGGVERLWKMPIDGGEPVRVTDFATSHPSLSPDGRLLAFTGPYVAVMPIEGGTPRRVGNATPGTATMIGWTADGNALIHNAGPVGGRTNLWLQRLDGSEPRPVTSFEDESVLRFDVSPDGKQLAIVRGLLERDAMLIRDFR